MSNSINASAPIENHSRVELAANKAATSNSIHVKQNVAPVISTESIFNKTKTVLNDLQAVKQKRQVEEGSVWTANTKKLSGFEKFYQIFKNILLKLTDPSEKITQEIRRLFGDMATAIAKGSDLSETLARIEKELQTFEEKSPESKRTHEGVQTHLDAIDQNLRELKILQGAREYIANRSSGILNVETQPDGTQTTNFEYVLNDKDPNYRDNTYIKNTVTKLAEHEVALSQVKNDDTKEAAASVLNELKRLENRILNVEDEFDFYTEHERIKKEIQQQQPDLNKIKQDFERLNQNVTKAKERLGIIGQYFRVEGNIAEDWHNGMSKQEALFLLYAPSQLLFLENRIDALSKS